MLSDELFAEALTHPIPADLEAIRVLPPHRQSSIYFFGSCTADHCFVAKGEDLTNQLGSVEYSRSRRFRAMLNQWLETIRAFWPTCPAKISREGRSLEITKEGFIAPRSDNNSRSPN